MSIVIGVTGPICSGKTTLSGVLKEKGARIIDADAISHSLLKKQDIKKKIVRAFGKEILSDRKINRTKLADMVFSDKKKLDLLCGMLHPHIKKEIILKIKASNRKCIVVDAPLLIETGLNAFVDKVLVIDIKRSVLISRAKKRGIKEEELKKRIKNQLPMKEFLKHADIVLKNNSDRQTFIKHILDKLGNLL
jgi:dephospho-CoA kinase